MTTELERLVFDLELLAFIRKWNGIAVYPDSPEPNQVKLATAAQRLIDRGLLAGRRDGEALLVTPVQP